MRVLIVEDEKKVARALHDGLVAEHFDVAVAGNGEEGFFRASERTFDLIVLDLMLPGRGGIEILTTLRKRGLQTPVLILTARDAVEDRVLGPDCGAGGRIELESADGQSSTFRMVFSPVATGQTPGTAPGNSGNRPRNRSGSARISTGRQRNSHKGAKPPCRADGCGNSASGWWFW
jgi:CheY-like chemotaxis protein